MSATGWRTRGYLPHRDESRLVQHLVFNLADAFQALGPKPINRAERLVWADGQLDSGHGERVLATPANAAIVEQCLLKDHGARYALAAWCVMPNHVHVLVEQFPGHALGIVVQTWKSVSAHLINKRENRRGALWQREYFDRFMRDEEHFERTSRYIELNPVRAGLVDKPEAWRFSSAWSGRWLDSAGEGAGAPAAAG
ncbi:MAG: transposase [Hyphomonadaceae bacterium]|nr:transposase [Hyphomonadaceae bacterium]